MPKTTKKRPNFNLTAYLKLVEWCALPDHLRDPKTQGLLADELGVDQATLSDYKKRPEFWDDVEKEIKKWAKEKTPKVITALYQGILTKKNAAEVKLWLQWAQDWIEKSQVEDKNIAAILELQKTIRNLVSKKKR